MTQCPKFSIQTPTLPPNMHKKFTEDGKFGMQNNQLPTKNLVELKDNSKRFHEFSSSLIWKVKYR